LIYHVNYSLSAVKQLKKLDKPTAALIVGWLRKNIEGCENPRIHGKALSANLTGQWRYRVGDYRIVVRIDDDIVTVFVINIGHRRDIYK